MIGRLRWACALVIILQLVLSATTRLAYAEIAVGVAEPKAAPPAVFALAESPTPAVPPQVMSGSLDAKKVDVSEPFTPGIIVPKKHNLAGLLGVSEISVLTNIDWRFVKNLAENQALEEEFARPVDETNLWESIRAGRSFNRESLAALARTDQAKAKTGQAFALLLPSVSVNVSSGYETSEPSVIVDENTGNLIASDTHTRTDVAFTLRQALFDLPGYLDWNRRKVLEQASSENYRVSDGDAYLSTVNAYVSLVSSRLQADITRDFETQLAELLSYIEKRASAGAASVSDMARVRARIEETLSSRLEQESAHATAGLEFVRLTNLVPQKVLLPVLEDIGASVVAKSFDLAVSTAMESNPEIAVLNAELQAAKINQTIAKGNYLPRVDAEFTDTYAKGAGGDDDSQRDQRYMMVLNWNLFRGGKDAKYHVETTARHKELQYRMDDQRRRVVQALSANYTALATTKGRIASGYQELESISTAVEAMSKRMISGNQSLLDLLDVYDRFFRARSRLVSLHVQEMKTVAQLVRLTYGAPWRAAEKTDPAAGQNQLSSLLN